MKCPFNSNKSFIKLEKLLHFYEIPLFVEQSYENSIYIFALSIYDMLHNWLIGFVGRVFTNGPGNSVSIPSRVI